VVRRRRRRGFVGEPVRPFAASYLSGMTRTGRPTTLKDTSKAHSRRPRPSKALRRSPSTGHRCSSVVRSGLTTARTRFTWTDSLLPSTDSRPRLSYNSRYTPRLCWSRANTRLRSSTTRMTPIALFWILISCVSVHIPLHLSCISVTRAH
jgi:hypothetical protein